jgi:hypothetical protein
VVEIDPVVFGMRGNSLPSKRTPFALLPVSCCTNGSKNFVYSVFLVSKRRFTSQFSEIRAVPSNSRPRIFESPGISTPVRISVGAPAPGRAATVSAEPDSIFSHFMS